MPAPDATCWTLIRDAAAGDPAARDRFARAYLPAVRAYLAQAGAAGDVAACGGHLVEVVEIGRADGVVLSGSECQ